MEFPKSPVYAFANDDELVQTEKYVGKEIFGEEFVLEGEDELFLSRLILGSDPNVVNLSPEC